MAGLLSVAPCRVKSQPVGKRNAVYMAGPTPSVSQLNVLSFIANQASLARLRQFSVGVYAERKFMQPELNDFLATVCLPVAGGGFGLRLARAGSSIYQESQVGLAYGKKVADKVDVGVQFNYSLIQVPNYGAASAMGFEVGTVFHVSAKLHTAFHLVNPVGGKFGKGGAEKLSSIYKMSMGYEPSSIFLLSVNVIKEESRGASIHTSIHYRVIPKVTVRCGMSGDPAGFWLGAGVRIRDMEVNILSGYHMQLGISPAMAIIWGGREKEEK